MGGFRNFDPQIKTSENFAKCGISCGKYFSRTSFAEFILLSLKFCVTWSFAEMCQQGGDSSKKNGKKIIF